MADKTAANQNMRRKELTLLCVTVGALERSPLEGRFSNWMLGKNIPVGQWYTSRFGQRPMVQRWCPAVGNNVNPGIERASFNVWYDIS